MPGQPAWTLTEMLECNLPLCWAGGGDCKVGPAQIMWRPNFLFSLKPIRATCFNIEKEACWLPGDLLFWSSEGAGRFYFSSRK